MLSEEKLIEKCKRIKLIALDVDGTLTDGKIIFDSNGVEYKSFNVRDGLGIVLAQKHGIKIAFITGRTSKIIENRAKELQVLHVKQGVADKIVAMKEVLEEVGLNPEQAAYIGDDINDLAVAQIVGLSMAVKDAHIDYKSIVDHVLSLEGGKGAVREGIDIILKAQGA